MGRGGAYPSKRILRDHCAKNGRDYQESDGTRALSGRPKPFLLGVIRVLPWRRDFVRMVLGRICQEFQENTTVDHRAARALRHLVSNGTALLMSPR